MRRTKEDAEQTKEKILTAGLSVFEEKSYDTATLSDIAKKAGVTRGAIYWHFENKFDILKELTEKYLGTFLRDVCQEMFKEGNSFERIKYLYKSYFTYFSSNSEMLKFRKIMEFKISYTENTDQINDLFIRLKMEIMENLKDIIENGQKNGEIRTDMSVDFLALSLITLILGYENILLSPYNNPNLFFDREIVIENIIKFIKA